MDTSQLDNKEFSGVKKMFHTQRTGVVASNKYKSLSSPQREGDDLVDPDFKPIFLYEIDEDSDLFISDQFESDSSSDHNIKDKDLQEIVEDEDEDESEEDSDESDVSQDRTGNKLTVDKLGSSGKKKRRQTIFQMKDQIKAQRKEAKKSDFKLTMQGSEHTSVYSGYKSYDPKAAKKMLDNFENVAVRDDKEVKAEAKGL